MKQNVSNYFLVDDVCQKDDQSNHCCTIDINEQRKTKSRPNIPKKRISRLYSNPISVEMDVIWLSSDFKKDTKVATKNNSEMMKQYMREYFSQYDEQSSHIWNIQRKKRMKHQTYSVLTLPSLKTIQSHLGCNQYYFQELQYNIHWAWDVILLQPVEEIWSRHIINIILRSFHLQEIMTVPKSPFVNSKKSSEHKEVGLEEGTTSSRKHSVGPSQSSNTSSGIAVYKLPSWIR